MRRRRWRAEEVGCLIRSYPSRSPALIGDELGRSDHAVVSHARRLMLPTDGRRPKQSSTRADRNRSVDIHFFDCVNPEVAFVLGFIWATGTVKTTTPYSLTLRCPLSNEASLLTVLSLVRSRHKVRREFGTSVCDVTSHRFVQTLLDSFGSPRSRAVPDPPLPALPAEHLPHFARGLLRGRGHAAKDRITWSGSRNAIRDLGTLLSAAHHLPAPSTTAVGRVLSITWTDREAVGAIFRWLSTNHGPDDAFVDENAPTGDESAAQKRAGSR